MKYAVVQIASKTECGLFPSTTCCIKSVQLKLASSWPGKKQEEMFEADDINDTDKCSYAYSAFKTILWILLKEERVAPPEKNCKTKKALHFRNGLVFAFADDGCFPPAGAAFRHLFSAHMAVSRVE